MFSLATIYPLWVLLGNSGESVGPAAAVTSDSNSCEEKRSGPGQLMSTIQLRGSALFVNSKVISMRARASSPRPLSAVAGNRAVDTAHDYSSFQRLVGRARFRGHCE